jgi:hypothetical protein
MDMRLDRLQRAMDQILFALEEIWFQSSKTEIKMKNQRMEPIPPNGRSKRSGPKKNLFVAGGQGRTGTEVDSTAKGLVVFVALCALAIIGYIFYTVFFTK